LDANVVALVLVVLCIVLVVTFVTEPR